MRAAPVLFALAVMSVAFGAAAQTNPFARQPPPPVSLLDGRWNGVNLERRTNCANPQNNGDRGTYAQFDVSAFANGDLIIIQSGITGLNCEYRGRHETIAERLVFDGTYSCTDGKQGSFRSSGIDVTANLLHIRFLTHLTGNEACTVDAVLSMARIQP